MSLSTEALAQHIKQIATAINTENYTDALEQCDLFERFFPQHPQLFYFRGAIASSQGQLKEAIDYMEQAIAYGPSEWPEVHFYLGKIYRLQGQQEQAIEHLAQVTHQTPENADAWFELAQCYIDAGQMEAAYPFIQEALTRNPEHPEYQNTLLFYLPAIPMLNDTQRKKIYQQWASRYTLPSQQVRVNQSEPERRLRIGYVSADFRQHAAANNLYPLFKHHDRSQFEIFAYSQQEITDDFTDWFKKKADHWREIQHLSDTELVAQIRSDKIDILVDCSGHTAGNRLRALSYRPAPIQVSAFGFVFTTGTKAIDYQFSDAFATPPGRASLFTERLIHLPSQIHWKPLTEEIRDLPISSSPSLNNGYITFGSGNGSFKHNEYVVKIWAAILKQVPNSQLHLKSARFGDLSVQSMFRKSFQKLGIGPERISFKGTTPAVEHLQFYNTIDIALDPFPYTGGMTTCDVIYMGVPLIALDGDGIRTSVSLLSLVGVPELIAKTPEEYVFKAVALAKNPQRLTQYRQQLRSGMQQSPIMQSLPFTRQVETSYRMIWHRLCQNQLPSN